eukprot:1139810-Pelagomonas_calceolata.AAC.1
MDTESAASGRGCAPKLPFMTWLPWLCCCPESEVSRGASPRWGNGRCRSLKALSVLGVRAFRASCKATSVRMMAMKLVVIQVVRTWEEGVYAQTEPRPGRQGSRNLGGGRVAQGVDNLRHSCAKCRSVKTGIKLLPAHMATTCGIEESRRQHAEMQVIMNGTLQALSYSSQLQHRSVACGSTQLVVKDADVGSKRMISACVKEHSTTSLALI